MKALVLKCDSGAIRFEITYDVLPEGWCTLFYSDGENEIRLGSNDLKAVFTNLLIGLAHMTKRTCFTHCGLELFTVMNIMDSHSTIAGHDTDDALELYHIRTDGTVVPLVCLTDEIKRRWISDVMFFLME